MQSNEEKIISCEGISVYYSQETDGGGTLFKDDYISVIRSKYENRIFNRCLEWCSGPGFIGYSILGAKLSNTLCLIDIYQPALEQASKTAIVNNVSDKVSIYQSYNFDSVPSDEKFDLIVSNPPHFPNEVYILDRRGAYPRKYMDRNWEIHRNFYKNVSRYLTDDGVILLQEFAWASGIGTFSEMIEDAGLKIKSHQMANYLHPISGPLLYYIEVVRD